MESHGKSYIKMFLALLGMFHFSAACGRPHSSNVMGLPCDDGYVPSFCDLIGGPPASSGRVGGYMIKNVEDEGVVEAAHFAAKKIHPQGGFKLIGITLAAYQVVAGMNYALSIDISNGDLRERHRVIVFRGLDGRLSLTKDALAQK
jgi:hypothetical protein